MCGILTDKMLPEFKHLKGATYYLYQFIKYKGA